MIWLIGVLIGGSHVSAQTDSSDLSFTPVPYEQQSLEDSIAYGIGELSQLHLGFELDNLPNFSKVWVEVFRIDQEAKALPVFFDSYTLTELNTAGFMDGNQVNMELMILQLTGTYYTTIRIEDVYGHEKISISKYLE